MTQVDKNYVRPLSLTSRLSLAIFLSFFRKVLGGDRFINLYSAIVKEINDLNDLPIGDVALLDYGCGTMALSVQLKNDRVINNFLGVDIFPAPSVLELGADSKWMHYRQVTGNDNLNFETKFDLTIVADVLHHFSYDDQLRILNNLGNVSRYILIKDHFEYGYFSRQLLRLADWYGNYAYGVIIPMSYYTQKS